MGCRVGAKSLRTYRSHLERCVIFPEGYGARSSSCTSCLSRCVFRAARNQQGDGRKTTSGGGGGGRGGRGGRAHYIKLSAAMLWLVFWHRGVRCRWVPVARQIEKPCWGTYRHPLEPLRGTGLPEHCRSGGWRRWRMMRGFPGTLVRGLGAEALPARTATARLSVAY